LFWLFKWLRIETFIENWVKQTKTCLMIIKSLQILWKVLKDCWVFKTVKNKIGWIKKRQFKLHWKPPNAITGNVIIWLMWSNWHRLAKSQIPGMGMSRKCAHYYCSLIVIGFSVSQSATCFDYYNLTMMISTLRDLNDYITNVLSGPFLGGK
jgi:hypothetical protein